METRFCSLMTRMIYRYYSDFRESRLCKANNGLSLIDLLVVVSVIAVLAAVLFPVLQRGILQARISSVRSDLRQVGIAIEAYEEDWKGLPPVRSSCIGNATFDYYELPRELYRMRYLPVQKMYDPLNRTKDDDEQLGRAYKYKAINWGYNNNTKSEFSLWIPRDYPAGDEDGLLYYRSCGKIYAFDRGEKYPKEPPIKWAVWSVGPSGDHGWEDAGKRMLPVPKSEWYPRNENGIIARFSDGRISR